MSMHPRVAAFVLCVWPLVGCTTSNIGPDLQESVQPLTGRLPPCKIDIEASEITLRAPMGQSVGFIDVTRDGTSFQDYTGERLRREVADAFATVCNVLGDTASQPARFRVRGSAEGSNMMVEALFGVQILWVIFPLPTGSGAAELTVDYEYGDKVYTSKVKDSVVTGLFYNRMPADDAFIDALTTAIADIVKQVEAAGAGR